MARRHSAHTEPKGDRAASLKRGFLIAASVMGLVAVGLAGVWVFARAESYLIRDAHFTIPQPRDYGEESDNIKIYGVKHAPRDRVRAVFARDIGRSLYLFPAAERRRNLLAIDWVKEANVQRVWPNEVRVHITERTPVAFVPAGVTDSGGERFSLIDEEGRLLTPTDKATFPVPVLTGVGPELDVATRKDRLRLVMRMLTEIGPAGEKLSEIDVAHPESLRVTMEAGGRAVTLVLGSEHYRQRLNNFLDRAEEIHKRLPEAKVLDLRLEDRITAVE